MNLFTTYAPSRDSVPEGSRDLVIPVNPILYPAMSTLVRNIVVCRCRNNDSRRSDGKAAPLVIMNPGFTYESSEIEESIEKRMMSKMQGMRSWKETVDHSVLVAHDLPRGEVYQAFGMEWIEWLEKVASKIQVLQMFDEFWLVTGQNIIGKAQRICGKGLNQH